MQAIKIQSMLIRERFRETEHILIAIKITQEAKEDMAMSSDGFTAVVNKKKKKGKKQEATQS
ncbi:hypothetical protein Tco_1119404, partial [Tanacetum coccineum]